MIVHYFTDLTHGEPAEEVSYVFVSVSLPTLKFRLPARSRFGEGRAGRGDSCP